MNINTNYSSIMCGTEPLSPVSKGDKSDSAFNALSVAEATNKQEDTASKLTDEQKKYLRSKYDLSKLTFDYALPGDEETLRQAIREGTYRGRAVISWKSFIEWGSFRMKNSSHI